MWNLRDKIAVVTGGASGIGLASAEALVEKGCKVILSDNNEQVGKEKEEEFKRKGADVTFIAADVSDEKSVRDLISQTVKKHGRLDVMVNNAGVGVLVPTSELTFEQYNKVISVNQNGVFFGSKYAIMEMIKTGGGCVINIASILGLVGQPGALAYNASKGAVNIMTKSLALEYARQNIRVNSICPGYVETGMVNKKALGEFYDGLVARHPVGRLGTADEIAHAVVFLCENEFTTGSILVIDGGYTA
jgi:NAD(P)-dependent dehydrogenase (short-subunit alcohol dehydrogenase family)